MTGSCIRQKQTLHNLMFKTITNFTVLQTGKMFTASNTIKVYIIKNEQNFYFIKGKQHGPQMKANLRLKHGKLKQRHEAIACIQAHSQT